MAASQIPGARTASTCNRPTARGSHSFKIADYSLHKGFGPGYFIRSTTFAVGGFDWCIGYYPEGPNEGNGVNLVVFIELVTNNKNAKAGALVNFSLVDHSTGGESYTIRMETPMVFNSTYDHSIAFWEAVMMSFSELEKSKFLKDDCLVLQCDITVIKGPLMVALAPEVQVPPSCLLDNLGKLLEAGDGADVTLTVKGESFPAHKIILAMQSPVFKAELYGPKGSTGKQSIAIKDMDPAVFKALLHFIYTDSLPSMDDHGEDEKSEMVKHLLVAADRYGVERMKLMCESVIGKSLDVESVAATLALADQYHCRNLKDACIDFINSSSQRDDLVASQGYEHLKRSCPFVFVDIFERASKFQKI